LKARKGKKRHENRPHHFSACRLRQLENGK
jgi:hypothetical protein